MLSYEEWPGVTVQGCTMLLALSLHPTPRRHFVPNCRQPFSIDPLSRQREACLIRTSTLLTRRASGPCSPQPLYTTSLFHSYFCLHWEYVDKYGDRVHQNRLSPTTHKGPGSTFFCQQSFPGLNLPHGGCHVGAVRRRLPRIQLVFVFLSLAWARYTEVGQPAPPCTTTFKKVQRGSAFTLV